ncbi:MAG: LuxR C-terminal-related transcriptional regulator [Hyphomonadaceae bacterium]|nr:LuxR C-terminal-related transcriptional regulator [Hyphomonadaceae bacterium]
MLRDVEARLAVYERALACRTFDDIESNILTPMSEYVEADTSCFLQFLPDVGDALRIGRSACHNVPAGSHAQYTSHYVRFDPAVEAQILHQTAAANVFCTSEVCDYSDFVRGAFYNEFFQPNRIHHVLVMIMQPDSNSTGRLALGFHRPRTVSAFSDRQKTRVRSLAAVACSVLRGLALQDSLDLRIETVKQLEQAPPETGVLFFDSQLILLSANAKGLEDLQLGRFQRADGGSAKGRLSKVLSACRELQCMRTLDQVVVVQVAPDDDMVASVQASRAPGGELLFTVHTSPPSAESRLDRRCADFGMTRRETDAVRLLRAGLSTKEIASRLFISPRTVENHLRSIYAKAGVNTRAQLLVRVAHDQSSQPSYRRD